MKYQLGTKILARKKQNKRYMMPPWNPKKESLRKKKPNKNLQIPKSKTTPQIPQKKKTNPKHQKQKGLSLEG